MMIRRTSTVSGLTREQDLPITDEQINAYLSGALIQQAFPDCTPAQREFFLSGISEEEWDAIFNEEH